MRSIRIRGTRRAPARRAQGGFVTARVALALVAATGVTAAVSGPLAYQTHAARNRAAQDTPAPTVTTPRPNVLGSTTIRGPVPTTPPATTPPATTPLTSAVPIGRAAPGGPPDPADQPGG